MSVFSQLLFYVYIFVILPLELIIFFPGVSFITHVFHYVYVVVTFVLRYIPFSAIAFHWSSFLISFPFPPSFSHTIVFSQVYLYIHPFISLIHDWAHRIYCLFMRTEANRCRNYKSDILSSDLSSMPSWELKRACTPVCSTATPDQVANIATKQLGPAEFYLWVKFGTNVTR